MTHRYALIQGHARPPGTDLAEYPPAVFAESAAGISIRPIPSHENRSFGARLMWQLRDLPDGAKVVFEVVP